MLKTEFTSSLNSMKMLMIRHVANSEPAEFQVIRQRDGKSTDPMSVVSPFGFPVHGRPESDLIRELNWYLETFLEYPFQPEIGHAERVLDSLRGWGQQAFEALFGDREGGRFFEEATREGHQQLHLLISSDDPRVLSWPWEALRDPEIGILAQACQIERRLNHVRDPQTISGKLPNGCVNILLVIARPYVGDVHYRSISRPLVELIEKEKLPAGVHVLRPPTFDRLREHLRQRPHFYHLIHFDGHGSVTTRDQGSTPGFTTRGRQGQLIFEGEKGEPQPISADQLSVLLREYSIPCMVLNACQSAMFAADAQDPFATVSAALLQAGIRSVVAMAWSLYVSAGQQFLPAFYRRLFETGNVAQATRAGRQQMFSSPDRVCARGRFPLQDWLVPVVYQQDPYDFSFAAQSKVETRELDLPDEVQYDNNPYGLVGRDGAILALERAMRRSPAGILIQGLGGIGKTTLARGFVQWLAATEGVGNRCFWFGFGEIRSAEFVFNRLGEALLGGQFAAAAPNKKIEALTKAIKEHAFLIVWDNFEVVQGIAGTAVEPTMPEPDRRLLLSFLQKLRGGHSKVLITSRSDEEWLGVERVKISLEGLQGEERWEYCERILGDLGISIDRGDKNLIGLMKLLAGHPLAMRVILPKLEKRTATEVIAALTTNLEALHLSSGDEAQAKLYATLKFAEQSLPGPLRALLTPLALHEGFVDGDYVEKMAHQLDTEWTRFKIDSFLQGLAAAGLLRDHGEAIYEMHPILTSFLRATWLPSISTEERDLWVQAFVEVMYEQANLWTSRGLDEYRCGFHWHGANLYRAMREANRLGMNLHFQSFLRKLGDYALDICDYQSASELFSRLIQAFKSVGDEDGEAKAYERLGTVALEENDLKAAEEWYRKSLTINEKRGNEHGAALGYHHLGIVAQRQYDLKVAEERYRKSLAINEKRGDEYSTADTYHQLGIMAHQKRNFKVAEECYRKSLAINEKWGNEHGAALGYHQLGMLAQEHGDLRTAEELHRKSLAIKEKRGDELGAASAYFQLGKIAQEQHDLKAAEKWYRRSLTISEKQGNQYGTSLGYHQLGMIAQEQHDLKAAEEWYRKSLAIKEKQADEHGAAGTYHQLGLVAQRQRDYKAAQEWYLKSLAIEEKHGNEHGAAITYFQLGTLEAAQEHYEQAGQSLLKAILTFVTNDDIHSARRAANSFLELHELAGIDVKAKLKMMWQEAGLGPISNAR
jgi:tetratricopeptide (TPR) repeat protein